MAKFSLIMMMIMALAQAPNSLARESPTNQQVFEKVFMKVRSDVFDVLVFRNGDVLRGKVANESLSVYSNYGRVNVKVSECIGVSFNRAIDALVTVQWNKFTGKIGDEILFKSGEKQLAVEPRAIRFVVFKTKRAENENLVSNDRTHLFYMVNGDLLTGTPMEKCLKMETEYADMMTHCGDIKEVLISNEVAGKSLITMRNGNLVSGFLKNESFSIDLDVGHTLRGVLPEQIVKIVFFRTLNYVHGEFGRLQNISFASKDNSWSVTDIMGSDGQYVAYSTGIVLDKKTGLEWFAGPDIDMDWKQASEWVTGLSVGMGGWRLPLANQLKALFKEGSGPRNITPLLSTTGWYVWTREEENRDLKGLSKEEILQMPPAEMLTVSLGNGVVYRCRKGVAKKRRAFAVRIVGGGTKRVAQIQPGNP